MSFWRVSCGGNKAALQMRLGRWGDPLIDSAGIFPRLKVIQNGSYSEIEVDALQLHYPAQPGSPEAISPGSVPFSPGMFVLTKTPSSADVDFNRALTLLVVHPVTGETVLTVAIPAYVPPAPAPLPINGRYVGNFFDPAKSGEGVIVEIGDASQGGWPARHYLQFSWFTYDNDGRPFWISGGGEFIEGDRHVHMPAIFRGGGRFAGGRAPIDSTPWGTVDMEFADCNTLRIGYNGNTGLPANVPSGSGQLEWHRLTGVSGYRCD